MQIKMIELADTASATLDATRAPSASRGEVRHGFAGFGSRILDAEVAGGGVADLQVPTSRILDADVAGGGVMDLQGQRWF